MKPYFQKWSGVLGGLILIIFTCANVSHSEDSSKEKRTIMIKPIRDMNLGGETQVFLHGFSDAILSHLKVNHYEELDVYKRETIAGISPSPNIDYIVSVEIIPEIGGSVFLIKLESVGNPRREIKLGEFFATNVGFLETATVISRNIYEEIFVKKMKISPLQIVYGCFYDSENKALQFATTIVNGQFQESAPKGRNISSKYLEFPNCAEEGEFNVKTIDIMGIYEEKGETFYLTPHIILPPNNDESSNSSKVKLEIAHSEFLIGQSPTEPFKSYVHNVQTFLKALIKQNGNIDYDLARNIKELGLKGLFMEAKTLYEKSLKVPDEQDIETAKTLLLQAIKFCSTKREEFCLRAQLFRELIHFRSIKKTNQGNFDANVNSLRSAIQEYEDYSRKIKDDNLKWFEFREEIWEGKIVLGRVLALLPNNQEIRIRLYQDLIADLLQVRNLKETDISFIKASELKLNEAFMRLGLIFLETNKISEAKEVFLRLISFIPSAKYRVDYVLGNAYLSRKDYLNAFSIFTESLSFCFKNHKECIPTDGEDLIIGLGSSVGGLVDEALFCTDHLGEIVAIGKINNAIESLDIFLNFQKDFNGKFPFRISPIYYSKGILLTKKAVRKKEHLAEARIKQPNIVSAIEAFEKGFKVDNWKTESSEKFNISRKNFFWNKLNYLELLIFLGDYLNAVKASDELIEELISLEDDRRWMIITAKYLRHISKNLNYKTKTNDDRNEEILFRKSLMEKDILNPIWDISLLDARVTYLREKGVISPDIWENINSLTLIMPKLIKDASPKNCMGE